MSDPATTDRFGDSYEVFVRSHRGVEHVHCGTVRAADPDLALQRARDLFTRRSEGVSIWLVPSSAVIASAPADRPELFDPAGHHPYRSAAYYPVPAGVTGL
ncbi:1,2-phenylacetyl-CoA epoxidase subunit PaaB [Pseudonocardia endophytica]|uniref:Ring-1,2-phenylacetyl-CoA epoxidase subunit PaaB n=1 Tax=Pseudonocardia endophytica TaxID=401976 RepID=A0A4R1I831_PSEEN|nr:1,2-phenylacetyl-CoA epoxidase subunit PaaB [Pseudonocardia endophytica]TCK26302.1 ring-1,2-phenylacetyl-CoA epoxidase subunit PaaB [Pseudonocardia endophytica]